jgi:nucleotide-binding universal stress UspA family protein
MEKKILLAVDGSENGFKTVSAVGQLLKDKSDHDLILFHAVQQLASLYAGLSEVEPKMPFKEQEKAGNAVLARAQSLLLDTGFPKDRIMLKLRLDSTDPGQDILAEAENGKIRTIALGRRGRGQLETLLLGSVSGKVAQYAEHRSVWIVDTEVDPTRKVLVAMEGVPDSRALTYYTAEVLAPIPELHFTFFHLMPPVPPTFWDDGHILAPTEQKDRQSRVEKWRTDWLQQVQKFMSEGRDTLMHRGVPEKSIETLILQTKEGIARDLLNEIEQHKFQMVVMGKRSFRERKPFLMGSHANKILQSVKGAILCLVDS